MKRLLACALLLGGCWNSHEIGTPSDEPDPVSPSPGDGGPAGPAPDPGPGPAPAPPPDPAPEPTPDPDPEPSDDPPGAPPEPRPGTCDFRGGDTGPVGDRCEPEGSRFFLVSQQSFSRVNGDLTFGFDLDGRDSDESDPLGCFSADHTGFDGVRGIDNVLGRDIGLLESVTDSNLDEGLHRAIEEGQLVTVLELRNLSGSSEDDCVDLYLHDGRYPSGRPVLDADGVPAPSQEVVLLEGTSRHFAAAHVVDGVLRASGGAFPMGIDISGGKFLIDIQAAELAVDLALGNGLAGGELYVRDFVRGAECSLIPFPPDLVDSVLTGAADLRPLSSGECAAFSVQMLFSQVAAISR